MSSGNRKWNEVQEQLYQRWKDQWSNKTAWAFVNEKFEPPEAPWALFGCVRLPGGPGTIAPRGLKRMDRVGQISVLLREPPLSGVGSLSILAEEACAIFENQRIYPNDIRFAQVEPSTAGDVEGGRWWGLVVEGRFDYEEII